MFLFSLEPIGHAHFCWNNYVSVTLFSLPRDHMLISPNYMHVQEAAELLKDGIDLVTDADQLLSKLLSYPLHSTLGRYLPI